MKFLKFVKIHTNSFYNVTSNCTILAIVDLRIISLQSMQLLNVNSWQVGLRTAILTLGEECSCRRFVDFVIGCS